MNLTTQEAQVACFRNAAAHLEPGGCFVIEVGVPGLRRLPPGETILAFHVSEIRWGFDQYDVVTQGMTSHHFETVDDRLERLSVPFRYAWPSEYDPDGTTCGDEVARALGRVEERAVHEREPQARVGVGEAGNLGRDIGGRAKHWPRTLRRSPDREPPPPSAVLAPRRRGWDRSPRPSVILLRLVDPSSPPLSPPQPAEREC